MSCSRTGRRPPERQIVVVERLAAGGDAVAHLDDGLVVFVGGAAPGDRVEIKVIERHRSYARAVVDRILTGGPARRESPCVRQLGGDGVACGGCPWMHLDEAAQREAKRDVVVSALRKVVAADRIDAIAAPVEALRWRRRARLRWRKGLEPFALGYAARRSHVLVDAPTCAQLEVPLEAAFDAARRALSETLEGAGELSGVVGARGDVHLAIRGRLATAGVDAARALVGVAGIRGVAVRSPDGDVDLGGPHIDLGEDAAPTFMHADAFCQASRAGNDALRGAVRAAIGDVTGARVLELHAGAANFTRDLVAAGADVTAVEEHAGAVALGAATLAARGAKATQLTQAAGAAVAAWRGPAPALVLVDPPRVGLEPGLAAALAALRAPRLIYVSCDAATLARDLALLTGYAVERVLPLDLMPQTAHVEVVSMLTAA